MVSLLAACGGAVGDTGTQPAGSPSVKPTPALQGILTNAYVSVGPNQRLSFGVLNRDGLPVPDLGVTVQIFNDPVPKAGFKGLALGPAQVAPYKGTLLQGKGVYVIHQAFDKAGIYKAEITATRGPEVITTEQAFQVLPEDPTPAIGTPAPKVDNPTGDPATDPTLDTGVPPDAMHYISVAAAIAAHHAVLVYLGSPGFCTSKTCGPEVDVVKSVQAKYQARGVDFVHIETYKGGHPDNSDITKATINPFFDAWKVPSDPWVFIIDRSGNVSAKFDGMTAPDELAPALDVVSS